MALTKLSNLINPQVMAQMISADLPKKIKFAPLANIDTTLTGQPGNTITVPKYAYIGDAEDVAEGVAMGTTVLTASTTTATIKKAGKAVELTDEAVLSGYGDPVGEAQNQLKLAIAAKIDNDCLAELYKATLASDSTTAVISYDGIVDAVGKFEDEEDEEIQKLIFVHPNQVTTLRKDPDFKDINKYPLKTVMTGIIGEVAGCQVKPSLKVRLIKYEKDNSTGTITIVANETSEDGTNKHLSTIQPYCEVALTVGDKVKAVASEYYSNPIVKVSTAEATVDENGNVNRNGAITIYMKRNVELEDDRDILAKTTVISADEHYGAVLSNDSKVVLAKFKK